MRRREFIKALSALAALPLALRAEERPAYLKEYFGERKVKPCRRIKLVVPPVTDSGAQVPVKVEAELPVEQVKALWLFADQNPRPFILKSTFSPLNGEVYLYTRVKLAKSGRVRAVLELKDGTLLEKTAFVEVKKGGCG
ncbi:MAG: thiosulfate oxidation carrier protein SoxY [Aquificae bacterium]|nr:thiosulfate oxidation carrier protein SoxY [Aquificota bacterium]